MNPGLMGKGVVHRQGVQKETIKSLHGHVMSVDTCRVVGVTAACRITAVAVGAQPSWPGEQTKSDSSLCLLLPIVQSEI